MNKKQIWLISQFTDDFTDNTSNRYSYIYNRLQKQEGLVSFITSSFDHSSKKDKVISDANVIVVNEPGYQKNTSLKRLYSHFIFSLKAYKYLKKRISKEDIVIMAIPSNSLAMFLARLKKRRGFSYIVDIHDTWPESLFPLVNMKTKLLFGPFFVMWRGMRQIAVKNCDLLLAESRGYREMHEELLRPGVDSHAILLGADMSVIKSIQKSETYINDKIKIVFAGTLGVNYDLDTTVKMIDKYATILKEQNIQIYFFGNGEKEELIKQVASKYKDLVYHLERTNYKEYISVLKSFDIGINSFQKNTNVRYSYKSVDYLVTELAVVNNLRDEFYKDINEHNLGANYEAGNEDSLYEALQKVVANLETDDDFYKKTTNIYVDQYLDREKIYQPLFDFVRNEQGNRK